MTRLNHESQQPILARREARPKHCGWRDQIRTAFRDPHQLLTHLGLDSQQLSIPENYRFPMLVPAAFAERMAFGDASDPLLRQVLPDLTENQPVAGFTADPVGDHASRQTSGLLHKYAGRVLLITTGACAIHCRYCFRQAFPYASERASAARWQQAVSYIEAHPDIEEVILSGGDPLMLSTTRLSELTDRLRPIEHIQRLRLHTRLPVVLPDRVTDSLCQWIASLPWPVVVVIHANHAREFDHSVDDALARLRQAGAHLLNQSVLLAGVNDQETVLVELMQRSFAAGVIPYYLHLLDRVEGAARFERDRQVALELHESMRLRLSGYLVPRLVREVAGAPYKLPVL
jgi:L-lysine 2,3-aminomutase